MRPRSLEPMKSGDRRQNYMILTVTILAFCLPRPGNAQQQCTNGFDLDRPSGQCIDIDECRTIPEACRGDMMCVNQNGGYLCIPRTNPVYRGPYSNPYSTSYSGPYPAAAPPLPAPNYPTISRPLICRFGFQMDEGNQCVDVDECATDSHQCNPTQICINTEGGYTCSCTDGYWLLEGQCLDINECEHRNHTCTLQQTCYNLQGGFKCIDPIRCEEPYIQISDNRCMCPAENTGCRDQPFTILYRDMDVVSVRSVPADIFQMQATTRYPGAYYIFQIKSGNEGREFYMRQTGPISATLVMTRPIKGPRDIQLDLEMITVNTVINFRGSSVIRLRIYVSQYPF